MNKKMLMLMAGGKGERGRRVGVEYEDWGPLDTMDRDRSRGDRHRNYYDGDESRRREYDIGMNYVRPEHENVPEGRFSDRRDRDHYDNGRYSPMSTMSDGYRDYRQYPDVRYERRGEYENPEMNRGRYSSYPIYDDEGRDRRMNPIGFARNMGGSDVDMPQHQEMNRMADGRSMQGYSDSQYMPSFDRQMAEEWAANMENEDGTRGPHWTLDQAKQVMAQKEIGGSPIAFNMALNMMYSDYFKVAKKLGVNTVDFYAAMAEAFLNDKDAVGGGGGEKLAAYYDAVVRH